MAIQKTAASGGVGLGGTVSLGGVVLVLKLTGLIDWSWWWVTAPIWGTFAIAAVIFLLGLLFLLAASMLGARSGRRSRL